jgi:hypothetical protein
MYFGAIPCKALKVSNSSLKWILNFTGNQCSSRNIGVMWSYFRVEVANLAAAFWTLCNLACVQSQTPKEFLWSLGLHAGYCNLGVVETRNAGISRNMAEYHGIWRNITEYAGISRNMPEYHGICRNITEYAGISRYFPMVAWQHILLPKWWIFPLLTVSNKQ